MRLGRYHLLTQIGAGSDGVSYRSQSEDGQTLFELFQLGSARENAVRWSRLANRLRLAARLEHPAVTRVVELALEPTESPFDVVDPFKQHAGHPRPPVTSIANCMSAI